MDGARHEQHGLTMTITLNRKELYDQVWGRPMTKVAAEYGISDVTLKKICIKHRVPVPGRGYWAKKEAGKKVKQTLFHEVDDHFLDRIEIRGGPGFKLPEAVKLAREAAKERERKPEKRVEVTEKPEDLDARVARTCTKLKKAKPDEKGLVSSMAPNLFNITVGPKSVPRVAAFLNTLVVAAESRGHRIVKSLHSLVFCVDDETLTFKVVEQTTRSQHEPTPAELDAIENWEKRQARRNRSLDFDRWTPRPTMPEWDYTPSGRLQVIINEQSYAHDGLRRTFRDGKNQRIETLLNAILEAFATWSAAIKAKRIEDERRRIEWEEEKSSPRRTAA